MMHPTPILRTGSIQTLLVMRRNRNPRKTRTSGASIWSAMTIDTMVPFIVYLRPSNN
jgi:hypothetical protein